MCMWGRIRRWLFDGKVGKGKGFLTEGVSLCDFYLCIKFYSLFLDFDYFSKFIQFIHKIKSKNKYHTALKRESIHTTHKSIKIDSSSIVGLLIVFHFVHSF